MKVSKFMPTVQSNSKSKTKNEEKKTKIFVSVLESAHNCALDINALHFA